MIVAILGLISIPAGLETRRTQPASNDFFDSYHMAWDKNQLIFAERALSSLSNYSLSKRTEVDNIESAAEDVIVDGRFNSTKLSNNSFEMWESRYQAFAVDRGVNISSRLLNMDLEIINLTLRASSSLEIKYLDSSEKIVANITFQDSKMLEGVTDPYLTARGYNAEFDSCGFNSPVSDSLTISRADYNGTGYGKAAVKPSMASITDPIERVLVTSNVSNYTTAETSGFAAVITNQSTISSSYNSVYASNVNISSIEDADSLIIHEGEVYHSHFREIIRKSCYLSVSGYPGVKERFANNTVNYNGSVATFINETKLSANTSKSSVGYEYFNGAGTLVEVAGVSYGRGNTIPWFRLSDSIASRFGISGLVR
ncbi:MAG: hypothetical protein ABEJ99_01720 [Candidatus Nanohaloarchaea archaeon]